MVSFEEVSDQEEEKKEMKEAEEEQMEVEPVVDVLPASQERLLDAVAIEEAAAKMTRVSARLHLESLAKKLRKESEALQRMEKSRGVAAAAAASSPTSVNDVNSNPTMTATTSQEPSAPPAVHPQVSSSPPKPIPVAAAATPPVSSTRFIPIDKFSFDFGGYNAPFVTLYVPLPGVGSISRDLITCNFTKDTFDLVVKDLNGKSYRLFKDSLEKDIDPDKSKIIVKSDKVIVKLAKIKHSEYGGYDYWSNLTDKKGKKKTNDDPNKSIMSLMKDMYEEGDDNMKKVIAETFMKQQRGELNRDFGKGLDDMDDI